MARITDAQGFVDDGSPNLVIEGVLTAPAGCIPTATTLANSGSVALPGAGFFYLQATGSGPSGFFTGSVPTPAAYPGAFLTVVDTTTSNGYPWQLTGSTTAGKALFCLPMNETGSAKGDGSKLTMSASSTMSAISNGSTWMIMTSTGSFTISGT